MSPVQNKFTLLAGALLIALLWVLSQSTLAFADDWSLKDKDGIRYKLTDLRGKWVLVNFWAPWCPPCIQELPELEALQRQHKELLVIGIAVQYRSKQQAIDMAKNQSVSYPIILGNEDTAADFGGLVGLPTSFLYSPAGKLIKRYEGPLTRIEIEEMITKK